MFDLKWIRDNAAAFDKGLASRGVEPHAAHILEMDQEHRKLLTEIQELQSARNSVAKQIGMAKSKGETPWKALLLHTIALS